MSALLLPRVRRLCEKYAKVFDIGLQNTFVYRWNFLLRSLFSLAPLAGTVLIWRTIFDAQGSISGYDYREMIWYFLLVLLIDNLITPTEDEWRIAQDIREGTLNTFLIKPLHYMGYRFSLFLSYRLVYTVVTIIPVAAVYFWFQEMIVLPKEALTWPLFGLSLVMAALLSFLIAYSVAMCAFWVLEISTILFIVYSFEHFLSGQTFPLDIMPEWFQEVLMLLPFPYQMFFPVQIIMERVSGADLVRGLCIQAFWVGMAWLLSNWLWNRGVRKYQAFGG